MSEQGTISNSFWSKAIKLAPLLSIIVLLFTVGMIWGKTEGRMFDDSKQKHESVSHSDPKGKVYEDSHLTMEQVNEEALARFVTKEDFNKVISGQNEIKQLILDAKK